MQLYVGSSIRDARPLNCHFLEVQRDLHKLRKRNRRIIQFLLHLRRPPAPADFAQATDAFRHR